jgi:membrane protease YdiL (CAAX protease family)
MMPAGGVTQGAAARGGHLLIMKRHPLIAFFVSAYALTWWASILYAVHPNPFPVFPYGPFLAAIIVLWLTAGKSDVKALLRRIVLWRVGLRWYVVALLLPVALALAAVYLNVGLFGAPAPSLEELGSWPNLLVLFPLTLLIGGPLGEEPGWRGYALPRLQTRRSALLASLILGALIALWHLPLLLTSEEPLPPGAFFPEIIAGMVVISWVYNNTQGSVLLAALLHTSHNAIEGFFADMFSGAALVTLYWMLAGVWVVTAVVVVVVAGPSDLSREYRKQEESLTIAGSPPLVR